MNLKFLLILISLCIQAVCVCVCVYLFKSLIILYDLDLTISISHQKLIQGNCPVGVCKYKRLWDFWYKDFFWLPFYWKLLKCTFASRPYAANITRGWEAKGETEVIGTQVGCTRWPWQSWDGWLWVLQRLTSTAWCIVPIESLNTPSAWLIFGTMQYHFQCTIAFSEIKQAQPVTHWPSSICFSPSSFWSSVIFTSLPAWRQYRKVIEL